ncbi:MAG: DUF2142 domain-containing protein [Armatimonadota bacterium]
MSPWSKYVLPLCLAAYLALSITWAVVLPLGQAPDEPAHFRYALFIAENGRLPDFHADDAGYESYQAPLYYTLSAAIGKLTMTGPEHEPAPLPDALRAPAERVLARLPDYETVRDGQHELALDALRQAHAHTIAEHRAWRAMRLFTVFLGMLGIFLAWRITFLIFPTRGWIAATVGAFMAAQPMYVHITSSVGNDPPATAAAGLILLLTLLILRHGPNMRRCALLGLALGLGALTKTTAAVTLPVALLAVIWAAGKRHEPEPGETYLTDWARRAAAIDWPRALRCIGVALGVAAVVAGWWYVRNIMLYGTASPFPANVEKQVPWEAYLVRPDLLAGILGIALPMTFRNFWAGFAWTNIAAPLWVYWLLLAIVLPALPGLVILVVDARRDRLDWSLTQVRGVWLLILAKALLGLAVLWYILTIDLGGGSQGRYMFPVLGAMALLWAIGIGRLLPKNVHRWLPALVGAGMLAFNLWCLLALVVPFYRAMGV